MDTAALQVFYRCYRERHLAEAVAAFSDDFQFKTHLPNDPVDPTRPRSRAEFTLLCHKFLEDYDIDVFEPGEFIWDGEYAYTQAQGVFRHKQTGKVLETTFQHRWHVANGKVLELVQDLPVAQIQAFLDSVKPDPA
jgi:ketosteroid isomerase-like protein